MPTVRTVTVKSSGGDYTSLSAAEAAEQGDLPTLDRQLNIECYSMADTTTATIFGWTTDATRYIAIYAPTAERHSGVWDTNKYRLSINASASRPLFIVEDYVRVTGLQIENTHTGGYTSVFVSAVAASPNSSVLLDSLIIRSGSTVVSAETEGSGVRIAAGAVTLRNCIIYSASLSCIYTEVGSNTPVVTIDNCTIAGSASAYGVNVSGGTVTLQNCYSGGNSTDDYNGTMTLTTCAHSSATVFTGSTASIAHSTANFTNVTAGSEDYHLISSASSTLLTGGTDLSGTFTVDIDGETRSDWSIGADEYVAVTGNPWHYYAQQ